MPQTKHTPHVSRSSRTDRPLWTCPLCGRRFANRNQTHWHSAMTLDDHFADADERLRATFVRLVEVVRSCGEIVLWPVKTYIYIAARRSFAGVQVRKRWLKVHVELTRRLDNPRFDSIEEITPRNILHNFRLRSPEDVDDEVRAWLCEAYRVGMQEHLVASRPPEGQ